MGIKYLTSYINQRCNTYFEEYELQNTMLVIDGCCIAHTMFRNDKECNDEFGGDYDMYAYGVSEFFDQLLKCNVTPLVIFDGCSANKKLNTAIKRCQAKIDRSLMNSSSLKTGVFPGLLLNEVFQDVLREKKIKFAQCFFEADEPTAAVARMLNCPVLSNDSDYFFLGSLYIPYLTLGRKMTNSSTGKGYAKRCRIYKVENLLNSFEGLTQSLLPLGSMLLGNDYASSDALMNFYQDMGLAAPDSFVYGESFIEMILTWLGKRTFDEAIFEIFSKVPKHKRQELLDTISTDKNGYPRISPELIGPLGIEAEYTAYLNSTLPAEQSFKFEADIQNLDSGIRCIMDTEMNDEEEQQHEAVLEILNMFKESGLTFDSTLTNNLPSWFINEYTHGKLPSYSMQLIIRSLYFSEMQTDDFTHRSIIESSLKIIGVVYELLLSEVHHKKKSMKYIIRGVDQKVKLCWLENTDRLLPYKLPALSNLRQIPLIDRRNIFDDTLGIAQDSLNELPPKWVLYIAAIKTWIEQLPSNSPGSPLCYLYSLLFSMLFDILDKNIGMHRCWHYFQNKYRMKIIAAKDRRKRDNRGQRSYSLDVSIAQACDEVDYYDCLLAAPLFLSYFRVNREVFFDEKKFNRYVVHAFSEFQYCLGHTIGLNALLGNPYPSIKIQNFFNGTFLYNVYNEFHTQSNIKNLINYKLENYPSLRRLFNVILLKVKSIFALISDK